MLDFKEIDIKSLKFNPFELIGDKWMLITAGKEDKFNTMTASWGGLGVLFNEPVVFSFIRPQRYTLEFVENNDYFSISFYDKKYKDKLTFCGTKSGRDVDKVKEISFNPIFNEKAPYFKEAKLVFICQKIHGQFLDPDGFIDQSLEKNYNNDYHKLYVGKIVKAIIKE